MLQTQRRIYVPKDKRMRVREQMQFSNKGILNKNSPKNFLFLNNKKTHTVNIHIKKEKYFSH